MATPRDESPARLVDLFLLVPFAMSLAPIAVVTRFALAPLGDSDGGLANGFARLIELALTVPVFVEGVCWLIGALVLRRRPRRDPVGAVVAAWLAILSALMLYSAATTVLPVMHRGAGGPDLLFWIGIVVALSGLCLLAFSLTAAFGGLGRGANKRIERTPRALS